MANLIPSVPNPTQDATKTLVLAHRTELLEQAQKQIQRFNPSLVKIRTNGITIMTFIPTFFTSTFDSVYR